MSASGDLRVSMLFEANTGAARAGVADLREATDDLNAALRESGGAADIAAAGTAEWGSIVQMMRAQMQPMVAEVAALQAGMQHLAVAEEMGAITAREATMAHDLLARQMIELVGRMEAAGVTIDGTSASVIRHDTALQQLINTSTGVGAATDQSIADTLRHGQALDQLRAQFDPLFAASRQYELQLAAIAEAERQGAITLQVAEQARARAAAAMGSMDDVLRQQAAAQREADQAAQAHAARLEYLQNRYNPLISISRQYEQALGEIAEAEREGVITAQLAAQQRERAAMAMAPMPAQLDGIGRASGAAASYVANLGYQLNDIGMMMALGQSPFALMMQQGPQVVQVFGQMRAAGMQIGPAIASAFTSMLNPLSLATMAVIGFGAAAYQWFTGAGEEAISLGERIDDLTGRVRSYRAAVDDALTPLGDLRREWAAQAGQVRELYETLALLERLQALQALNKGVAGIREEFAGLKQDIDWLAASDALVEQERRLIEQGMGDPAGLQRILENQKLYAERLREEFGLTVDQAQRLQAALDGLDMAQGPEESAAALGAVRQALAQIIAEGGQFSDGFLAAARNILNANMAALELEKPLDQSVRHTRDIASVNMAGGISAAASQARLLAASLGLSLDITRQLAGAAQKPRLGFGSAAGGSVADPIMGGVPVLSWGPNPGTGNTGSRDPRASGGVRLPDIPNASGAGGGGGGTAAEAERRAVEELIEAERRQIATLIELDPVQRELMRNHEALTDATGAEKDKVEELIRERMRLEEISDRINQIEQAGKSAFEGLVSGAHGFTDAISMVIAKLAEMAASSAWDALWGGSGLGALVGGMFGGGSSDGTGTLGLPAPFAEGGRVLGPGGPRDDRILARLSNGEYVVNAEATARHLPLIEALNAGAGIEDLIAIIGGARPAWPMFADGGLLGSVNGSSAPAGWGLSGSRGGAMGGGGGIAGMKLDISVRAYFDDKQGRMMAEVERISREVSTEITAEGIQMFSAYGLPGRMAEIDANPRVVG